MKEKIQKSYILLGNLPIGDDFNTPNGCKFIINARVKYEQGLVSIQFIEQVELETFSLEKAKLGSEIELDISSLIKLKTFLRLYGQRDTEYIKVFSTRLLGSASRNNGAFIKMTRSNLEVIIDDKNQKTFKIPSGFQFESFKELIIESLDMLKQAYIQYDVSKVLSSRRQGNTYIVDDSKPKIQTPMGTGNSMASPPIMPIRGTTLPASNFAQPITPKPVSLPDSITAQVVPQAPDFNVNIPDLNVQTI